MNRVGSGTVVRGQDEGPRLVQNYFLQRCVHVRWHAQVDRKQGATVRYTVKVDDVREVEVGIAKGLHPYAVCFRVVRP